MSLKKSNRTIESNIIWLKKTSFFLKTINFHENNQGIKRKFLIDLGRENLKFRKLMDQFIKDGQIENFKKILEYDLKFL
jgi:hypothetical protein